MSSGERRGDINGRSLDLPIGESEQTQVLSPTRNFYSPTLGDHMVPQDGFEFADSDLGVEMMNRSNSAVYSPVFSQYFYQDKPSGDMNKSFSNNFGEGKPGNINSNPKMTPPMIMLPSSVTRTDKQNVPFTQLLSQITDNSVFYAEIMEQINHVSTCRELDGTCSYPLCLSLQRDLFHTQKCEDPNCTKCQLLRPLILLHSINCKQDSCEITMCSKYREAWEAFVQKLTNTPIPNLEFFVTARVDPKSNVKSEKNNELITSKKAHTRSSKSQMNSMDSSLKESMNSISQKSPQLPETDIPKSSMSLTPLSAFILPGQSLSASASPLPHILQTPKPHVETSKVSANTLSVQYIVCCKCGKHRAVPSTLDVSLLPHFECSMNIWDDNKYNNCMIEENVDINYSINLSRKGPNYEQDCSHFVNKLKSFLATNQIMSYRPPTLGRKEVDLYRLFREVTAYGGCDSVVSKEGTWAKIYRGLDNFSPTETSASFRLKKMYTKYLLAYEKHIFNFLPIPAKKHRFPHGTGNSPLTTTQPSSGIQNSAIFPPPPPGAVNPEDATAKRPARSSFSSESSLLNESSGFNHHPIHQSVLNSNTKFTPGAGIGLTGGSVTWNTKNEPAPTTRMTTRSGSMKRTAAEMNQSGSVLSSNMVSALNVHSDEILGKQNEPENTHRMTTRSKSSRNSPIPSFISSPPLQASFQDKNEMICKSPLLTGEDAEGAEGLKALMGLRSSLSPMTQAAEEAKWGALLSAANDNANDVKLDPLEKLPGPAMK